MNLKSKIAFSISLLFTIIFAVSVGIIYFLFADFRKDEFENRLKQKAISSIKLLVEVEQVDRQLLKVIDLNSINKLYNEKTLIFDSDYKLIYSSLDDIKIDWSVEDLKKLKLNKTFFRKENENEVYGFFYDTNDKDYFALVSADDSYGKRKLTYLLYILIITYLVFSVFIWLFTYKFVKKLLLPLDAFHIQLKEITEKNLNIRIPVKEKKNEIDLLAVEFNQMLERINQSYIKQQEFTANASHELRTPIARLIAQIENKIIEEKKNNIDFTFHKLILDDVTQLSDLTNSLLLLSKLDNKEDKLNEICRLDEIIFDAAEKINKIYADFKMEFAIDDTIENIEIKGHKALVCIAFENLFKNCYLYSDNKIVKVGISIHSNHLTIIISNNGKTLSLNEQKNLFEPFMRGKNSKNKSGLGLGLRIVKRILSQQKATIEYSDALQNMNTFKLTFPII
jgi:signal transduction histidine kinase